MSTTDTRRRVKLYALNADRQWDDRGTGHVSSSYVDRLKGISLLVRAESDGSLLLESKILPDTAYQKQQDTLIVWSEGDNFDLALSFQEKAGCDEIWEKICQVQGKDPSVEITQDIVEESEDERFDEMSDSAPPIELPSCELSRLEDISELISNCLSSQIRKEKLSAALESDGYIRKLINVFHMCEDLENLEGLHHLYDIFKNIFLLNKNALFEVMFGDELIFDVVGCLEYDPASQTQKHHREYLKQQAMFREAIPIKNTELLSKIHQTFRVQYIQDVVLPTPSVFEENMLSTLSSFIFFNKVEIVSLVQEDERFLTELFTMLTDSATPAQKRRDLVLFLKEFCNYSQNLQPQAKEGFYKTLTSLGILPALEITLASEDSKTKTASIDILTYIVEFSPSVVREYTLQQANSTEEDQILLNIIIEQMICDTDPELGGAVQLMGVLRILLDPENMLASLNKSEKTDFLNFFYKHSVQILIAPLLENTAHDEPQKEDYRSVQLLGLILELLSFCVEHHTYHIKNCILNKDLLRRILVLMKSTHKFLVLCALRFMRKLIALKDEFYNRYIIKGNLFAPVVDAFVRNKGRYNLLDSAIIEMFEFIKLEDIKTLCSHVVENYGKCLDSIGYVQTFKALKLRYDQHQDKLKDRERNSLDGVPSILRNSRYRRDQRQMEEEEEMWFNEDDDFEETETSTPTVTVATTTTTVTTTSTLTSSGSTTTGSATVVLPQQQQHQQQNNANLSGGTATNNNVSVTLTLTAATTTCGASTTTVTTSIGHSKKHGTTTATAQSLLTGTAAAPSSVVGNAAEEDDHEEHDHEEELEDEEEDEEEEGEDVGSHKEQRQQEDREKEDNFAKENNSSSTTTSTTSSSISRSQDNNNSSISSSSSLTKMDNNSTTNNNHSSKKSTTTTSSSSETCGVVGSSPLAAAATGVGVGPGVGLGATTNGPQKLLVVHNNNNNNNNNSATTTTTTTNCHEPQTQQTKNISSIIATGTTTVLNSSGGGGSRNDSNDSSNVASGAVVMTTAQQQQQGTTPSVVVGGGGSEGTSTTKTEAKSNMLKRGLVDYEGGDSDEEDEENGEVNKRPRLS